MIDNTNKKYKTVQDILDNLQDDYIKDFIKQRDKDLYKDMHSSSSITMDAFIHTVARKSTLAEVLSPAITFWEYKVGEIVRVIASDKMAIVLLRHSNVMKPEDFFAPLLGDK